MPDHPYQFEFVDSVHKINPLRWNELARNAGPFLQHAFFTALEDSQSIGNQSGWQPHHLIIYENHLLVGILPLFIKSHSYGEYVFDFAWANAYQQHDLHYYPKLVNAIPFTPVSGCRLLSDPTIPQAILYPLIVNHLKAHIEELQFSSYHSLFNLVDASQHYQQLGLPLRHSVQFQWFNKHYADFDDFLSHFTARRRKSVKNERKKVFANNIQILRLTGNNIAPEDMTFFYHCYCQTYLKRSGHSGYLSQAFFDLLLQTMADNVQLVIATKDGVRCAGALYLFDQQQLCGRYWGALEEVSGLHFECCYYQGIDFCIENSINSFNPGTQGEHKILRGFEPIYCYSNHWLKDPRFQQAIEHFIHQESSELKEYKQRASRLLPFKQ